MKRVYAFAIGLIVAVTPIAATGLATADPATKPMDYQQATDVVVNRALSQRGVPFSWAGGGITGPTRGTGSGINTVGFDASGLMQYAYAGAGLKLPRSSGQMYKVGQRVAPAQARKGDLVFYGPEGTQAVAMYLGNGQMIEVGDVVQVSPVRSSGMTPYLVRILGTQTTPAAPAQPLAPAQQAPAQQVPGQQVPTQQVPGQQLPAQQVPGQQAPLQQAPLQSLPTQQAPLQAVPGQQPPLGQVPAQQIPGQQAPLAQVPGQQAPLQAAAPGQQAPLQAAAPGQQAPLQAAVPGQQAPLQAGVPGQQAPLQQVPAQQAPLQAVPTAPLQLLPAQPATPGR